jgi:6-phosphofructokinase 2
MADVVTVTPNPALDVSVRATEMVPGRKLRSRYEGAEPGGGGINVARALLRLGVDTVAVLPVGGTPGMELELLLRRESVPVKIVQISGETRRSTTVHTSATNEHYRLVGEGPQLSAAEAEALVQAAREAAPSRFLVLSGSLPDGLGRDFVLELAAVARETGAKFVVDTSGDPLKAAVEAHADLIKPNRRELTLLAGYDGVIDLSAIHDACKRVIDSGVGAVVASLGATGAFVLGSDGAEARVYSPFVDVQSTVGAGDALLAGTIAGLVQGSDVVEAVRLGVAAGSAATLTRGTQLFSVEEVQRLARETAVVRT